eukprot:252754-Lingulodinium_polyedra.AAC.1
MLAASLDEDLGNPTPAPAGGGAQSSETTRVAEVHLAAMKAVGTAQEVGARATAEQAARAEAAEEAAR